jgi:hypothetical protein
MDRNIEYIFRLAQQIEEAWRRMQRLTHATSYPKPYAISYLYFIVFFLSVSRSSTVVTRLV